MHRPLLLTLIALLLIGAGIYYVDFQSRRTRLTPEVVISEQPILLATDAINMSLAELNRILGPHDTLTTTRTSALSNQLEILEDEVSWNRSPRLLRIIDNKQLVHPRLTITAFRLTTSDKIVGFRLSFPSTEDRISRDDALRLVGLNPSDIPSQAWSRDTHLNLELVRYPPAFSRTVVKYTDRTFTAVESITLIGLPTQP